LWTLHCDLYGTTSFSSGSLNVVDLFAPPSCPLEQKTKKSSTNLKLTIATIVTPSFSHDTSQSRYLQTDAKLKLSTIASTNKSSPAAAYIDGVESLNILFHVVDQPLYLSEDDVFLA
jgi:hypothetical protein